LPNSFGTIIIGPARKMRTVGSIELANFRRDLGAFGRKAR
jgi:hypothetical protein